MRTRQRIGLGVVVSLACSAYAGDEVNPVRRYQIELLYTMHTNVDTDEKLERIRALVVRAYPDAKFAEVSVQDRKIYFATYRDRLLATAGSSWASLVKEMGADPDSKKWDDALREKVITRGHEIAKDQVAREVTLRSIYQFLHLQAKDDTSLKQIFDKLKERDDPKNPTCGTDTGKTPIVYRDFGGRALSGEELTEIEDGGVKFGLSFKPRVTGLGTDDLPKMSRKADGLGPEWEGRQIFRLVAVTSAPAPPPDRK